MSYFDSNVKKINGPINVVRLEGEVNNIKKIIYVFFDLPSPRHIEFQKKCDNIYSKDIQNFLFESFFHTNKSIMYDFFLKIGVQDAFRKDENPNLTLQSYMGELKRFFRELFSSKYLQNIRFHYMGLRILDVEDLFHNINHAINNISRVFSAEIHSIRDTIPILRECSKHLEQFFLMFKSVRESEETDASAYSIKKLYSQYKHPEVKKSIQKIMNSLFDDLDNIIKYLDKIIKEFENIANILKYGSVRSQETKIDMKTFMLQSFFYLKNFLSTFFDKLSDTNFLRRFLDKDYVTNAIVYTMAPSSDIYVKYLVDEWNFKITHAAYVLDNMSIKELNSSIKETLLEEIPPLLWPKTFEQCSDMTLFPKDFL